MKILRCKDCVYFKQAELLNFFGWCLKKNKITIAFKMKCERFKKGNGVWEKI